MKSDIVFLVFYYFLALLAYLISLPFLFFLSFRSKYKRSIPARFFLINNPPFFNNTYWFHTCSLGETKAIKPLIEKFEKINLSVITQTGFEEGKKYKNADVRYLPFEIFLPFWIKPCKTMVVMEAELWYMLFYIAKRRCAKTVLINARISDKSFPKYMKFKWFYKKIFKNIDLVLAQSEEDKKRLILLGAKNVEVVGNIKTYFNPHITTEYQKQKPLIVVASTHMGEEESILKNLPDGYQIVVVPRHPERFNEVYNILKRFGEAVKLSEMEKKWNQGKKILPDLLLVDKMGELVNFYAIADIVILGGSFVDNVGGHNPIEPAYFNTKILSGKYIFNQKALYKEVEGIEICEVSEIKNALKRAKKTKIKRRIDIDEIVKRIMSV